MCSMPEEFTNLKNLCIEKAQLFGCPENVMQCLAYSTTFSDLGQSVLLTNNKFFIRWLNNKISKSCEDHNL